MNSLKKWNAYVCSYGQSTTLHFHQRSKIRSTKMLSRYLPLPSMLTWTL